MVASTAALSGLCKNTQPGSVEDLLTDCRVRVFHQANSNKPVALNGALDHVRGEFFNKRKIAGAIDQRLGIAERLVNCIEDWHAPERVRHGLAEMIRYRALLIAAGYPDGNDCDLINPIRP